MKSRMAGAGCGAAAPLKVRSEIDHRSYPLGVKIPDTQMATVKLEPHTFHGDWDYTIHPTP